MKKEELKIVFMGTPEFAVESLRMLVENQYNIVGVITMPDKPAGRGHKLQPSAVKKYALENNLPLLQPEKLKDETFLQTLKSWNAGLQVVVAFRMLPEAVWDMPRFGTFNLHASLLPQYRGAAPINWAVINGEKETGATTFFLTHEIDTGKIIKQVHIPISETDNAGTVHDKLMTEGAELVRETVDLILEGKADTVTQDRFITDGSLLKPAPKIFKETCRIDWNLPVDYLFNFIRGLALYPAAWTELQLAGNDLISVKIYAAEKSNTPHDLEAGTIETDNKTFLQVACKDGFLKLSELQMAGKKAMKTADFLRGFNIEKGFYFK